MNPIRSTSVYLASPTLNNSDVANTKPTPQFNSEVVHALVPTLGRLLPHLSSQLQTHLLNIFLAVSDSTHRDLICQAAGNTPLISVINTEPNSKLPLGHFFNGPGIALKTILTQLNSEEQAILKDLFRVIPNKTIIQIFSSEQFQSSNPYPQPVVQKTPIVLGQFAGQCYTVTKNENSPAQQSNTVCWISLSHSQANNLRIFLLGAGSPHDQTPFQGLACIQTQSSKRYFVPVHHLNQNFWKLANWSYLLHQARGTLIHQTIDTRNQRIQTEWHGIQFGFNGTMINQSVCSMIQTYPDQTQIEFHEVTINSQGDPIPGAACTKLIKKPNGHTEQWLKAPIDQNGIILEHVNGHYIRVKPDSTRTEWVEASLTHGGQFLHGSISKKKIMSPNGQSVQWSNVVISRDGEILPSRHAAVVNTKANGNITRLDNVELTRGGRPKHNSLATKTLLFKQGISKQWENIRIDNRANLLPSAHCNFKIIKPNTATIQWLDVYMDAQGFQNNSQCCIKITDPNGTTREFNRVRINSNGRPIQNSLVQQIQIDPNGQRKKSLVLFNSQFLNELFN